MSQAFPGPARQWLAVPLVLSVGALLAACSSSTSPAPTTTTVTAPQSTSNSTPAGPPTLVPPSSSPTATGPAECTTTALRVRVAGAGVALGTAYYHIDFTNISGAACFVDGYPGVSLVSAGSNAGSQVGADAKRDASRPANAITLEPGQTANALLGIANAGNFPPSTCNPVTAHWMKVFPPDQFAASYVKFSTQTCASTSEPTMHITRMAAGA